MFQGKESKVLENTALPRIVLLNRRNQTRGVGAKVFCTLNLVKKIVPPCISQASSIQYIAKDKGLIGVSIPNKPRKSD